MDITIGGKPISFAALGAAAAANHYPDILFFAGGKCVTAGKVKIRISLSLGNQRLKKWSETVEHFEVEGTPFGNMFDGYLLKKDDVEAGLSVKCEINDGGGYVEVQATNSDLIQVGTLQGLGVEFTSAAGNIATFGFVVTA